MLVVKIVYANMLSLPVNDVDADYHFIFQIINGRGHNIGHNMAVLLANEM